MTTQRIDKSRVLVLLTASFLANFGIGVINFNLVYFINARFSAGGSIVGWMSSVWAAAYLIGCIFLNKFRKITGPGISIIIAAAGMGISAFLMPFQKSVSAVFILYAVFGLVTSMYWPPLMGWLSLGIEGRPLSRVLGYFNLSWSTGMAVSPYAAGLIIERNLTLSIFLSAAVYTLILAVFILLLIFRPALRKSAEPGKSGKTEEHTDSPLRLTGWLSVFSVYLFYGCLLFVFPLYAKDVLGLSESSTGLILLFRAVLAVIGFQAAGALRWWHHRRWQMLIFQFLTVITAVTIAYSQALWLLVIMTGLFGLIYAQQYSNSIFHGVSGSRDREKRMAVHESFLTSGIIAGAAGGGMIYEYFSFRHSVLFCAFVLLVVLIFQLFLAFFSKKFAVRTKKQENNINDRKKPGAQDQETVY